MLIWLIPKYAITVTLQQYNPSLWATQLSCVYHGYIQLTVSKQNHFSQTIYHKHPFPEVSLEWDYFWYEGHNDIFTSLERDLKDVACSL